jgi:hypothetical protein
MTNPDAREFLRRVVARISKEWGYKYIKIDGQLSGMAVKMLYPSLGYSPDNYGDAVLHDAEKTQVESYRMGLKLVREAAGDDVFILGCNVPQNGRTLGASFGTTDGMRIGHDVGAEWGAVRSCVAPPSHLYFLHNKVWYNDPDCLMLRDPLTLDQARAWGSLIAISGQMNVVSEWLPDLPPEKLDVIKRTMPNHGGMGRPVDLFENNLPGIWHYQYTMGDDPVDLVGLFNWDEKNPATVELELKRIGLSDSDEDSYVGFDFWENEFVGPLKDKLTKELRASSCRVIALHCQKSHPQLVSTSRHVTQGVIDVLDVDWDAEKNTLRGHSNVVAEDPYELRIVAPEGFRVVNAGVSANDKKSGVTVELNQPAPQVRVTIKSPTSRKVSWNVRFEK